MNVTPLNQTINMTSVFSPHVYTRSNIIVLIIVFTVFTALTLVILVVVNHFFYGHSQGTETSAKSRYNVPNCVFEQVDVNSCSEHGTEFESLKLGVVYPGKSWPSNPDNKLIGNVWSTHFAVNENGEPVQSIRDSTFTIDVNINNITLQTLDKPYESCAQTDKCVDNDVAPVNGANNEENSPIIDGDITGPKESEIPKPTLHNKILHQEDESVLGVAGSYDKSIVSKVNDDQFMDIKSTIQTLKTGNASRKSQIQQASDFSGRSNLKTSPIISVFSPVTDVDELSSRNNINKANNKALQKHANMHRKYTIDSIVNKLATKDK